MTDPTPVVACPWCPDYNPRDPRHRGASHVMCPTCAATLAAQLVALGAAG